MTAAEKQWARTVARETARETIRRLLCACGNLGTLRCDRKRCRATVCERHARHLPHGKHECFRHARRAP
jgi:hypothetical protein